MVLKIHDFEYINSMTLFLLFARKLQKKTKQKLHIEAIKFSEIFFCGISVNCMLTILIYNICLIAHFASKKII